VGIAVRDLDAAYAFYRDALGLPVAKEGVAYSYGEYLPGVTAVAVAVRRADGYPLGAVNVAVPSVRFDAALQSLCVRELKAAAKALESELQAGAAPRK